jgi:hypothetical protein
MIWHQKTDCGIPYITIDNDMWGPLPKYNYEPTDIELERDRYKEALEKIIEFGSFRAVEIAHEALREEKV